MNLYSWALVGLAAAGIALALVASVDAFVAGVRLNKRIAKLLESPFVTKLESLQIQADRLARTSSDIEELQRRAGSAISSLRTSFTQTPQLRDAWSGIRKQAGSIAEVLR